MGTPPPNVPQRVIAVSARFGARTELVELKRHLESANVPVTVVASLDEAIARSGGDAPAEALLLDASFATELQDTRLDDLLGSTLRRVRIAMPAVPVIIVAAEPPMSFAAAAFRAGAADVLDLEGLDKPRLLATLARAAAEHRRRIDRQARVDELRSIVDEFLRALVRTEKRVLELEEQISPEDQDGDLELAPRVLVVDDEREVADLLVDHLSRAGLTALVAETGEQAVELLQEAMARREPVDLALVDKHLPGIDGLATIVKLRGIVPSLPIMVMTGFSNEGTAIAAADLGVVGYVLKPFDDVRELADRVKESAARYATERRRRRHLARIKQRHAQFLERYKHITSELDSLRD